LSGIDDVYEKWPSVAQPRFFNLITLADAKRLLGRTGWLSQQPTAFQAEIWRRARLAYFRRGDMIYHPGDSLGGVYGIISGAAVVTIAPPLASPLLFHVCLPGDWFGEGCFLAGEPRRVGMQAAQETWTVHLPLDAMEQIARRYPPSVRRFTKLLMNNLDILVRAFNELHNPDQDFRIASALERITSERNVVVPLSQGDIGIISHTSRKQVSAALKHFEAAGWLKRGYRSIEITDRARLQRFVKARASVA
jgi:CRP-like cAMP-binding protein